MANDNYIASLNAHNAAKIALATALGVAEEGDALTLPKDLRGSEEEVTGLLESARKAHESRREYDAVANLLELESLLAKG